MKLIEILKNQKKELTKNKVKIEEELLVLFGKYIREYQRNVLFFEEIEEAFNVYGYKIVKCNGTHFLLKDINDRLCEIYYNEELIELMALYGDEESQVCMNAILDWKRTHGYEVSNNWKNINNKWVCNQKKFKKHPIKI